MKFGDIRQGMQVIDIDGTKLGVVTHLKYGQADAATTDRPRPLEFRSID